MPLPLLTLLAFVAFDGGVISTLDENPFKPPAEKARAESVEGKVGRAVLFRFEPESRGAFCVSNLRGTPEWDRAEGFSFWVKGEGRDGFGGIEFVYDDDYALRYDLCFPVRGTEWTKVTVAWSDLIPVLPGPRAKPLGGREGNPPSKITAMWVGKWWYWGDYPALSFALDEIRLEPRVERPPVVVPDGPPLARVRKKLEAGKPVTIVTMGDSLTDKRHWTNREVAWVDLLRDEIRKRYGAGATIVNPAIGGTQLRQNLVLMPRWLAKAPEPDLVTIFFGGNDFEAGMRGPEFRRAVGEAIDRVRQETGGKADVLVLTTFPGAADPARTAELAEACREAAKDLNAGLADVAKAAADTPEADRGGLYVDDRVHLARPGHDLVARGILKAITGR